MGIFLAESNPNGTRDASTERTLWPRPTFVDYGDTRFRYKIHETDGGGVIQRSKKATGEFKWVWENYSPDIIRYQEQYEDLVSLQSHILRANGVSPYVWIKDDTTDEFSKYNLGTGGFDNDWIRCLIGYVGRVPDKRGGNLVYSTTEVRFIISDDSITTVY